MQIVIEIPKYIVDMCKASGCVIDADTEKVGKAIATGSPLPEHHGRLIDADKYIENMHKTEWLGDDVKDEYLEEISVDTFNEITPTIIPATAKTLFDKMEEEFGKDWDVPKQTVTKEGEQE